MPDEVSDEVARPRTPSFSIPALAGLVTLAVLSVGEALFPRLKWLTFPAMVVTLTYLVGLILFRRAQAAVFAVRWLKSRASAGRAARYDANSATPIEPE